jgi:hypothetical protein
MKRLLLFVCLIAICNLARATDRFIDFTDGDFLLCKTHDRMVIRLAEDENIGVRLAVENLCRDFSKVCQTKAELTSENTTARIVVATLNSSTGKELIKQGIVKKADLQGKWEKFIITSKGNVLYIVGSDRRGTIYGIYELSRQIGVSPWYYWMDAPVRQQKSIYVKRGSYTDGEPAVRYRGIFLNDEAPCLTTWVKNTFGTDYGGHEFYEKVFELLLRLKGNYIWPAMWGWAFYADDSLNSKTANDMGIMVGTSHHEPMCRSQQEWHRMLNDPNRKGQAQKGNGKWDYASNKDELDRFWLGGVTRNKNTEDIVTIGMRGDGDMAMSENRNLKLLKEVIANQRKLISKARHKPAKEVPQLWALYKEVQDYYDDGLRVPDDVTILLCDDNWGDVRRVPNAKERKRKGGWGLYYHVDYVGAPRNSKLLNVTPTQNMWEQLELAYNYGIRQLWILNVGDLKPMEYPIQLFMDMAWNPNAEEFQPDGNHVVSHLTDHTRDFCAQIFGEGQAAEAARILNLCGKYNGRCTPEMLDAKTYNLASGEWQRVVDEYKELEIDALRQYAELPEESKDAYHELILFPVQLMGNLHEMYYAQAMNNKLHAEDDARMNEWAARCEQCFKRDSVLMAQYNQEIANGKWNGMMVQKHIGYTSWNDDFEADRLPKLFRTTSTTASHKDHGKGYIAINAEEFAGKQDAGAAEWTVIPYMGRTRSAMTLWPQTEGVDGAWLEYKFEAKASKAKVHIVTKSTLDFLNKGGLSYSISVDGGQPICVNFNKDLNEKEANIYTVYYPTVARRVVEQTVELPLGDGSQHTLKFMPNDPGIVLENIVVDLGGYTPQYLFGAE